MANQSLPSFQRTILSALNSKTTLSLPRVQQSHAHILKTCLDQNTHFITKLISVYANNLCFSEANLLLDSIPDPNFFAFSTLIHASSKLNRFDQALLSFSKMVSHGLLPDSFVIPSVVKACGGLSALKIGKQVHGIVIVSGCVLDLLVMSSMVHMYIKCDDIRNARKLFDRIPEPDVVIWSALISGYARRGCIDEAKGLFDMMVNSGVEPNLISWNGMIAGFNYCGLYSKAVDMFQKMHLQGFCLDGATVSCVLPAVGDLEDLNTGIQIHGYVIKEGLGSDKCVVSSLIDMYGKCSCSSEMSRIFEETLHFDVESCNAFITGLSRNGLVDDALRLFDQIRCQGVHQLNVVSWTSTIACCSQNGKDIEALQLFREMQIAGVKPNSVTIPCLLPACGNIAALTHGKAAHCFSLRRGITNNVYVCSALIDMYSKCGKIQASRLCFDGMVGKNLVCWNTMMGGYAMHGKANEALEIFNLMQKSRQKPDFISFTSILSACSQNGLTKEGWFYFNSMKCDYAIEPRVEHYACMVTLLSRVGKLEEAYSMIKKMPVEPDGCVWGALLSSCRVHNNLNIGEIAANKLFVLEPKNPGNYVLLSNIYSSKGMWNKVDEMRNMMKSLGLKKNPGCSWIEIKNKLHMLLAGDKSHPNTAQIMEKLSELSIEMKKSGYNPITNYVLQDVEEQEKEHILCGHSEKLAVVFGILNTNQGLPLRVIKNLRICGDCHEFIKFISGFEGREIFVRDTNRFHHFREGVCSCGDYW